MKSQQCVLSTWRCRGRAWRFHIFRNNNNIMCIMATNAKPTATSIVLVPATDATTGEELTCLMYTNALTVAAGTPGLMIVPFPNPTQTRRVGMFDVRTADTLRAGLKSTFSRYEMGRGYGVDSLSGSLMRKSRSAALPVHIVGNYKISVAPNAAELMANIDWSKFTLPADLALRLTAITDASVVPFNAGFVVAEAITSVKDDGFAVVYPGRSTWFPTCHETQTPGTLYDYDVLLYAINATSPDTMLFNPVMTNCTAPITLYAATLPSSIVDLRSLPTRIKASDAVGADIDITWDAVKSVTFAQVKGTDARNRNVGEPMGRDATPFTDADEANVRTLGVYKSVALAHYPDMPAGTVVFCNKCSATITSEPCIHYASFDMCMTCIAARPSAGGAGAGDVPRISSKAPVIGASKTIFEPVVYETPRLLAPSKGAASFLHTMLPESSADEKSFFSKLPTLDPPVDERRDGLVPVGNALLPPPVFDPLSFQTADTPLAPPAPAEPVFVAEPPRFAKTAVPKTASQFAPDSQIQDLLSKSFSSYYS